MNSTFELRMLRRMDEKDPERYRPPTSRPLHLEVELIQALISIRTFMVRSMSRASRRRSSGREARSEGNLHLFFRRGRERYSDGFGPLGVCARLDALLLVLLRLSLRLRFGLRLRLRMRLVRMRQFGNRHALWEVYAYVTHTVPRSQTRFARLVIDAIVVVANIARCDGVDRARRGR